MRSRLRALPIIVAGLLSVAMALAQERTAGTPERGRALVVRSCNTCHLDPDGQAPLFPAIANKPGMTPEKLRELVLPKTHPKLGFDLSEQEMADFIAYMETLRPRRS